MTCVPVGVRGRHVQRLYSMYTRGRRDWVIDVHVTIHLGSRVFQVSMQMTRLDVRLVCR
jgi:hypothetical protein